MKYPEITCPFCRMQFGSYKKNKDKIIHLDFCWSSESGLQVECESTDINNYITNTDDRGNITFIEEYKKKLDELRKDFEENPIDFDKNTTLLSDYIIGFKENMNYGNVCKDDEEYMDDITQNKIEELYNSGVNLKDCLRNFIKKETND